MDGYSGWFLSKLARKEDTVYAPKYTDAAFRQLAVGMSEQQVTDLLGPPLEVHSHEDDGVTSVGWRYSRSARGASYRIRVLRFRDGHVAEIYREFYLD